MKFEGDKNILTLKRDQFPRKHSSATESVEEKKHEEFEANDLHSQPCHLSPQLVALQNKTESISTQSLQNAATNNQALASLNSKYIGPSYLGDCEEFNDMNSPQGASKKKFSIDHALETKTTANPTQTIGQTTATYPYLDKIEQNINPLAKFNQNHGLLLIQTPGTFQKQDYNLEETLEMTRNHTNRFNIELKNRQDNEEDLQIDFELISESRPHSTNRLIPTASGDNSGFKSIMKASTQQDHLLENENASDGNSRKNQINIENYYIIPKDGDVVLVQQQTDPQIEDQQDKNSQHNHSLQSKEKLSDVFNKPMSHSDIREIHLQLSDQNLNIQNFQIKLSSSQQMNQNEQSIKNHIQEEKKNVVYKVQNKFIFNAVASSSPKPNKNILAFSNEHSQIIPKALLNSTEPENKVKNVIDQVSSNEFIEFLDKINTYSAFKSQGYLQIQLSNQLIPKVQTSVYSKQINMKARFTLNKNKFVDESIVDELVQQPSYCMIAFAHNYVKRTEFFKIVQSIYFRFHKFVTICIFLFLLSLIILMLLANFALNEMKILYPIGVIFLILQFCFCYAQFYFQSAKISSTLMVHTVISIYLIISIIAPFVYEQTFDTTTLVLSSLHLLITIGLFLSIRVTITAGSMFQCCFQIKDNL